MCKNKNGFSLVELSIVLVILGLLVGGVLGGQSLIRAAEIRKTINEHTALTTAMYSFRERYRAWPGDMPNAHLFWGTAMMNGASVTCSNTVDYTDPAFSGSCSGNGDGIIAGGFYYNIDYPMHEGNFLFQHLEKAGMGNPYMQISQGLTGTRWLHNYIPEDYMNEAMSPGNSFFPSNYGNRFAYTKLPASDVSELLPTEVAWQIDSKIDDGKPGAGKVSTFPEFVMPSKCNLLPSGDRVNGTHAAIAEYDLSATSNTCYLLFLGY